MASIDRAMLTLVIGLLLCWLSPSNAQNVPAPKEHRLYKSVKDICPHVTTDAKKCDVLLKPGADTTMLALATYELGLSLLPSLKSRVSKCLSFKGNNEVAIKALSKLHCELKHANVGYLAAKTYVKHVKTFDPETKKLLRRLFPWATVAARNDRIDLNRSEWEDRSLVTTMKQLEELFYLSYMLTAEIDPKAGRVNPEGDDD